MSGCCSTKSKAKETANATKSSSKISAKEHTGSQNTCLGAVAVETQLLRDMTDLFKVLADETRMRIITALAVCELCVCDLAQVVQSSQSAVSHQLRILRQARLVKYRKEGRNTFYMLDDEHVEQIIHFAKVHTEEKYS